MQISSDWARRLVTASAVVLFLSLGVSAGIYYTVHDFSLRHFNLSDLQWYKGNPDGYLVATIGPMIAMLLILPLTRYFHHRFKHSARRTALLGGVLLELTVFVFVANALLSAMATDDWFLHGILAKVSFALFILSNLVLLHAALIQEKRDDPERGRVTPSLLLLTHVSLFIILVVFIGPYVVGYNYPNEWVALEPNDILGTCEVLYLILGYVTLFQLTRPLTTRSRPLSSQ